MTTKYHFPTEDEAWKFLLCMAGKLTITDYGVDENRSINKFYVELQNNASSAR